MHRSITADIRIIIVSKGLAMISSQANWCGEIMALLQEVRHSRLAATSFIVMVTFHSSPALKEELSSPAVTTSLSIDWLV